MKVAIVGGGLMGAATGWRLTKRGVDVVCFDRFSPPHPHGSSHGSTRIIRTAYWEGPWYVPLLHESFDLWHELESIIGARLLQMTGALMIGTESSSTVRGAMASAREHDLDVEYLNAAAFRKRYRGHVVRDDDVAVLDLKAGILDPEACVTAMLAQVPDVRRGTTIHSIDELVDDYDAVVVAAGPWTPELIDWLPLKVERQVHAWFTIARDAEAGNWFAPDKFPVFIRETPDFGNVYGFPALDGRTLKVGVHHDGDYTDADHIKRRVDEMDIDPLRLMTSTYLRGVSGHAARTLTCMYTNTPDHDFVIDFSPRDQRVIVISACSGHGFKFGPVIGDIAADLVIDGKTSREISRFSAARFAAAPHVPGDKPERD